MPFLFPLSILAQSRKVETILAPFSTHLRPCDESPRGSGRAAAASSQFFFLCSFFLFWKNEFFVFSNFHLTLFNPARLLHPLQPRPRHPRRGEELRLLLRRESREQRRRTRVFPFASAVAVASASVLGGSRRRRGRCGLGRRDQRSLERRGRPGGEASSSSSASGCGKLRGQGAQGIRGQERARRAFVAAAFAAKLLRERRKRLPLSSPRSLASSCDSTSASSSTSTDSDQERVDRIAGPRGSGAHRGDPVVARAGGRGVPGGGGAGAQRQRGGRCSPSSSSRGRRPSDCRKGPSRGPPGPPVCVPQPGDALLRRGRRQRRRHRE